MWDGSTWSAVSTPSPVPGEPSFGRIACRRQSDCLIVGTSARENDEARTDNIQSWAMHWDGRSWSRASVPRPDHGYQGLYGGPDNELYDVACVSSECWAVGYAGTTPPRYVILRWNGTKWVSVPTPHPNGRVAKLTDLACLSSSDCWAQGWIYSGGWTTIDGFQRLHWNGTRWEIWHQ
jgi:hypothetical protein